MPTNVRSLTPRLRAGLDLPRTYISSLADAGTSRHLFDDLQAYCMFVGYARSGHSLLGSLLDAHPNAVIAHELDALRYFRLGFTKKQVYSLILENARLFAAGGCRAKVDYNYAVPNQYQGRYERLQVIGDKKGGRTTRRLADRPALLERVRRVVAIPLRIIHVVRNPYDNIATMHHRTGQGRPLDEKVAYYFSLCATIARLKQRLEPDEVIDLRHEELVADPESSLARVGAFLGLEMSADYVRDCSSLLFTSPSRTRDRAPWTNALQAQVDREIRRYEFLEGYSFEG
ncbi:MAG: sulfotransferase [Actinomycetota bacterium]|nr:sulfotransferase [Actinomycetota bacterium]